MNLQGTAKSFTGQVRTISSLMAEYGHQRIDLLKLDIEGAEHEVVPSVVAATVRRTVICVEFDQPVPLRRSFALCEPYTAAGARRSLSRLVA
jgi:Methyltransferase FkbM domain